MAESVGVGDKFPSKELVASDGRRLDLESLSGPAVIYIYPADGSSTCTLQAISFNRALADYQSAGVALVGISIDDDDSHRGFASDQGLQFPLVTDPGGELSTRVGVMRESGEFSGYPLRTTFLVDQDAVVREVWQPADEELRDHPAQVLAAARALTDG